MLALNDITGIPLCLSFQSFHSINHYEFHVALILSPSLCMLITISDKISTINRQKVIKIAPHHLHLFRHRLKLCNNQLIKEQQYSAVKGLSSSYFNFDFCLYFIPLHPYIPKIKNSEGGGTLISDILTQMLVPPFSLEILRKFLFCIFYYQKFF